LKKATQLADQLAVELEVDKARIETLEAEKIKFQDKAIELQNSLIAAQARASNAEERIRELRLERDRAYTDRDNALTAESKAREEAATLRGRLEAFEAMPRKQSTWQSNKEKVINSLAKQLKQQSTKS